MLDIPCRKRSPSCRSCQNFMRVRYTVLYNIENGREFRAELDECFCNLGGVLTDTQIQEDIKKKLINEELIGIFNINPVELSKEAADALQIPQNEYVSESARCIHSKPNTVYCDEYEELGKSYLEILDNED